MKKWIIVLLTLFITACSSAPVKNYYQLPSLPLVDAVIGEKLSVLVEPINLADQLNYDGIVVQSDDVQYVVANNNLWLTPLDRQLHQTLLDNLSALLPADNFTAQNTKVDYILSVQVDRFNSRYDGHAIISGNWSLLDVKSKQTIQRRFYLELPLIDDGYPALVRVLAQGWQALAKEIAGFIKTA